MSAMHAWPQPCVPLETTPQPESKSQCGVHLRRFVPASFAWFTPQMYAPGLGFLMFAVGVNLRPEAFAQVFRTPQVPPCRIMLPIDS